MRQFPAFWSRESGLPAPLRLDSAEQIARFVEARRALAITGGMLVANPVPLAATKGTWAGFGDIVATAASEGVLELLEKAINRARP